MISAVFDRCQEPRRLIASADGPTCGNDKRCEQHGDQQDERSGVIESGGQIGGKKVSHGTAGREELTIDRDFPCRNERSPARLTVALARPMILVAGESTSRHQKRLQPDHRQ